MSAISIHKMNRQNVWYQMWRELELSRIYAWFYTLYVTKLRTLARYGLLCCAMWLVWINETTLQTERAIPKMELNYNASYDTNKLLQPSTQFMNYQCVQLLSAAFMQMKLIKNLQTERSKRKWRFRFFSLSVSLPVIFSFLLFFLSLSFSQNRNFGETLIFWVRSIVMDVCALCVVMLKSVFEWSL